MVCNHCVAAVRRALSDLDLPVVTVEIGRAEIDCTPDSDGMHRIARRLEESGFELISDPEKDLVESIKREIIMLVRSSEPVDIRLSDYLVSKLHRDYNSMSRLFSAHERRTIERYMMLQKIERVKELLLDGELNVSEIAYITGFSSNAHLSRRFKEITGMTPSEFRLTGHRQSLSDV